MRYYTDGYEMYSAKKEDIEGEDFFAEVEIEHQEGDFFLIFMDGEDEILVETSLDKALESWSCNCDNIYQIRNDIAIRYFSTQAGSWKMNQPFVELVKELVKDGYKFWTTPIDFKGQLLYNVNKGGLHYED